MNQHQWNFRLVWKVNYLFLNTSLYLIIYLSIYLSIYRRHQLCRLELCASWAVSGKKRTPTTELIIFLSNNLFPRKKLKTFICFQFYKCIFAYLFFFFCAIFDGWKQNLSLIFNVSYVFLTDVCQLRSSCNRHSVHVLTWKYFFTRLKEICCRKRME